MTDPNNSERSIRGDEVGKSIAKAIAQALRQSSREAENTLKKLQDEILSKGVFTHDEAWEIKRRVAEAKISVFAEKPDSEGQFQKAWDDIELLGFTNVEREATMTFYRARHLISVARTKHAASQAVARLEELVRVFGATGSVELQNHYQKLHEKLRNELDLFP